MTLVKRNIIANFAGQGWIALMGFIFVPFYLRFIGVEGYGLVGFFVLLSSAFALMDGGLGDAATRQIAGYATSDDEGKRRIVALLRSIESIFWMVAVLTGLIVAVSARLIATYWLNVEPGRI